jgi:predicted O-methyltransferase YrrM
VEFISWFEPTGAKDNFTSMLSPFEGEPNLNFLQLGVYTGDASVWLMENILTDNTSTLTDIDTWQGSQEEAHESIDFEEVYKFYQNRTNKYSNCKHHRMTTWEYLRFHPHNINYDFIYIDADHTAIGTLLDAEMSWDLLKYGGILAFDDYQWRSGKGAEFDPAPGINTFLTRHQGEFKVIHKGWQVWIYKD